MPHGISRELSKRDPYCELSPFWGGGLSMNELTILQVKDLKKYFPVGKKLLHAVDGVSFSVTQGTTLGVVGE